MTHLSAAIPALSVADTYALPEMNGGVLVWRVSFIQRSSGRRSKGNDVILSQAGLNRNFESC